MADIFEIQERAKAALIDNGVNPPSWIEPEKLMYLQTEDGADKTAGRCKLHVDNPPTIWICNHYRHDETGVTVSLREEGESFRMSDEEHQALLNQIEQNRIQRDEERKAKQEAVAENVRRELKTLPAATDENPYLKRNGVHSVPGLRQDAQGNLVIPAWNSDAVIVNVQRIPGESGKPKLWQKDGKAADVFFPVCKRPDGPLYIGEGISTMLSVYEATGAACWSVFQAGNLLGVAKIARDKFPDREIVIAGDEDTTKKDADGRIVKRMPEENVGRIKAMKAAEAIGAQCAICPEIDGRSTDYNDLHIARGIEAVRKALDVAVPVVQHDTEAWKDIVTFASDEHPEIDFTKLPTMLSKLCLGLAEQIQVPADMVLGVALSAFSSAAQRVYSVDITPSWKSFLNLYVLVTADKSNRKSPVFKRLIAPIIAWQNRMRDEFEPKVRIAKSHRASDKKRVDKLRDRLAVTEDFERRKAIQREIDSIEEKMPDIPIPPRIIVEDITPERLAVIMDRNNGCVSIMSSEGGVWQTIGGRYSDIPNYEIYLKGYDGEFYSYDRSKDGGVSIPIDHCVITFGIMGQPSCMRSRSNSKEARDRGIDCRFCFITPRSNIGFRKSRTTELDAVVSDWYDRKIENILDKYQENKTLKLSKESEDAFFQFRDVIEEGMRPGGPLSHMTDWFGKLDGKACRLAGLLHIIENDFPEQIDIQLNTMKTAIYLAGYFGKHAKLAYAMMGSDDVLDMAKVILDEYIVPKKILEFSKHDCHKALRGRAEFFHANALDAPLKELDDRGYIRKKTVVASNGRGGRPSGPAFEVNPSLFKG